MTTESATDLVDYLRDQISELTLRLDSSNELCLSYKDAFLHVCSSQQVCKIMSDLSISGCIITDTGWDNMDQPTKDLFLHDLIYLAKN